MRKAENEVGTCPLTPCLTLLFVGSSTQSWTSMVQRITSHRPNPVSPVPPGQMDVTYLQFGASHLITSNNCHLATIFSVLLFLCNYIKQPEITKPFVLWAKSSSLVVWLCAKQIKCSTDRPSCYRSSPQTSHTYLISFLRHCVNYSPLRSFSFHYLLKAIVCLYTRCIFKMLFRNAEFCKVLAEVGKLYFNESWRQPRGCTDWNIAFLTALISLV